MAEHLASRQTAAMLWEIHQQSQIHRAGNAAERAEAKANRYADDIRQLGRRLDRLTLTCQAMWEILRDTTGITEADIENRMVEIDARDGAMDGKMTTRLLACPSCQRPTNTRRTHCMICGAAVSRPHLFEG